MMKNEVLRPYFLVILLVGVFVLVARIFEPFFSPLILAAVFAVIVQVPHTKISKLFPGWPSLAALFTVLLSTVLILIPLSFVGVLVANEAHGLYASLAEGGGQNVVAEAFLRINDSFGGKVPGLGEFSRNISANIDVYTKEGLQWVAQHAGAVFSGVTSLLLGLFIFFVAFYYLLRDGKRVRQMIIKLSPLNDEEDERVFKRLELAVNSIIKGSLTVSVMQGILTGVGFTIFGVPNGALWGVVAVLAALIPGIGTSLVLVPAIVFLFVTGTLAQGIGLLVWGAFAVGLIDNFIGPKLVGNGMQLHPLLVLLSVLGGIMLFGPIGIFTGPLSLSLLFALLSVYSDILRGEKATT